MSRLTARARKALPKDDFALSRVSQNGSPAEKAKVRAAVSKRYPGIGKGQ